MRGRGVGSIAACLVAAGVVTALGREPPPAPTPVGDGRVAAGEYVEIDTEGRANREFLLAVREVSPNIVQVQGRHGWVAFASFDADKKEYRGFFEWPSVPGRGRPAGKWADLYQIRVLVKGGVLQIEGKSAGNELLIRAKSGAEVAPKAPDTKR